MATQGPPDHLSIREKLLAWLGKRGENHKNNLQLVITGAGIFFVGAGILVWTEKSMPSSVKQELIALVALVICALGCLTALVGYLGLSIFRLIRFFRDDDGP